MFCIVSYTRECMEEYMEKTIYLIRHGESESNIKGNVTGVTDVNLTEKGIQQAQELANIKLLDKIEEVHVSSLKRAQHTCDILFENRDVEIFYDGLIEMNFGDCEGVVLKMGIQDEIDLLWNSYPSRITFPNGDNLIEHSYKSYNRMKRIVQESDKEHIAFVTHSATMRLIEAIVLGMHLDHFRRVPCDNCSITTMTFKDNDIRIKMLNVTSFFNYMGG